MNDIDLNKNDELNKYKISTSKNIYQIIKYFT